MRRLKPLARACWKKLESIPAPPLCRACANPRAANRRNRSPLASGAEPARDDPGVAGRDGKDRCNSRVGRRRGSHRRRKRPRENSRHPVGRCAYQTATRREQARRLSVLPASSRSRGSIVSVFFSVIARSEKKRKRNCSSRVILGARPIDPNTISALEMPPSDRS